MSHNTQMSLPTQSDQMTLLGDFGSFGTGQHYYKNEENIKDLKQHQLDT